MRVQRLVLSSCRGEWRYSLGIRGAGTYHIVTVNMHRMDSDVEIVDHEADGLVAAEIVDIPLRLVLLVLLLVCEEE